MPLRPLSTLRSGLKAASYPIGLLSLIGLLAAPPAPAVAQTLPITEQARQLMDLAERSYPEYFPGHEATRPRARWRLRGRGRHRRQRLNSG
jgi:hypothetical protein